MTDVLDEEAQVEDPTKDLDDPREESKSDGLVGGATSVVEGHDGIDSGRPNSGLPAKTRTSGDVCMLRQERNWQNYETDELSEAIETIGLHKLC